MSPSRSPRLRAAWLCLAALAFSAVVLPGLHVVVHAVERSAPKARAVGAKAKVVASKKAIPPPADHGHSHGEQPGEPHGADSPEHLQIALLSSAPPMIPPPVVRVTPADPSFRFQDADATPARGVHGARAPPAQPS